MNINELKEKLVTYENQLENAKAQVYRIDGIVNFIRFEIEQVEKAADESKSESKSSEKPLKQVK